MREWTISLFSRMTQSDELPMHHPFGLVATDPSPQMKKKLSLTFVSEISGGCGAGFQCCQNYRRKAILPMLLAIREKGDDISSCFVC